MTSRRCLKIHMNLHPNLKWYYECNDLPSIPNIDGGVARRIEVVNFPSRFRDNPRPTEHNPHRIFKRFYIR